MARYLGLSSNRTLGAAAAGPADAILTVTANTSTVVNNAIGQTTSFVAGSYTASNIRYVSTNSEIQLSQLVPALSASTGNTAISTYSEQYGSVSRNITVSYAANGLITSITAVEA